MKNFTSNFCDKVMGLFKITSVVTLCGLIVSCGQEKKIGYVDVKEVFNGFEYKKELEYELTRLKEMHTHVLDSIENAANMTGRQINASPGNNQLMNDLKESQRYYYARKQQFAEDEATLVQNYDEKIIKQMNNYVKMFGKEKKYTMLYGATSDGSIMYADSILDVTAEVIRYINEKYKGK